MTSAQMKARLRAYGLPVKGSAADLADRLERLDAFRQRFGSGGLESLSRDEIKGWLDELGVKAWKLSTRPRMLAVAQHIATRREPDAQATTKRQTFCVVWRNPATDRLESMFQGLAYGPAQREADALIRDTQHRMGEVSAYLPELREERAFAYVRAEPNDLPLARHRSPEEEETTAAWYDLSKVNASAAGPALSGNRSALRTIDEKGARLARRVLAGRVRENPARRRRPSSPSPYADPGLWQRAKEEALRRAGGRHSARAMQTAGAIYRAAGGRYRGSPTAAQRSLARWTREDWTTATGEGACRQTARGTRCDRYLPRAAWQDLTPAQALATRRAKLRAASQYVPNTPAARAAGRRARAAPRPNPERSLRAQLAELRPKMAAAAQAVYDEWDQDDHGLDEELGGGGICDRVAEALWGVIGNGIPGVEIREGGWEGDDHAYLIVKRGRKAFVVDIPPGVYETGSGYSWRKRKGVQFEPVDVVIEAISHAEE